MTDLKYLLSALPSLSLFGEAPPLSLFELKDLVADTPEARQLVETILLEHDLMKRQCALHGETEGLTPLVLSERQIKGQEDLPEFLHTEDSAGSDSDTIWGAYFLYMRDMGRSLKCPFLELWAGFEVALKNMLSYEREKHLNVPLEDFFVAESLAYNSALVDLAVSRWASAKNPLQAEKELDMARWEKLQEIGGWFSFSLDEIGAYAKGLLLLHRWARLNDASVENNRELLTTTAISSPELFES